MCRAKSVSAMVGLRYDPPVLLLYGLDQVREHHRRKPQVVLGGFEALMTHVDGKVRKGCCEISSLSHPFVQNTNSIGVSNIMEARPLPLPPWEIPAK